MPRKTKISVPVQEPIQEPRPNVVYNGETDVYITTLKSLSKPLVLKGSVHRNIVAHISNLFSPSKTTEEVAAKFGIPVKILEEYKKVHGLTRDSLPLSNEELTELPVEACAANLLESKKLAVAQSYEKELWKATQKSAENWEAFQNGTLDPFGLAVENWKPARVPRLHIETSTKEVSDEVLVIGLSDLHFGSASNERYMFNRPSWTTEKTVACVKKFAEKILQRAAARTYRYKKVVILGLGDLIHSVNGKTGRGTELLYDCVREEQFDYALQSLYQFISMIYSQIPVVDVHSVGGNHNYEGDMALFRALEKAFTQQENLNFFHHSSRPAAFKEGTTLFLLDHGADSIERAYVPTASDAKLQTHVQSLLLQNPENLIGVKERLFIVGDRHHWEHVEYNDFQFVMFSTVIGGDMHASVNNLKNRPRQSYLVIDNDGLKETGHVYFD
jgi:hypothetical protein